MDAEDLMERLADGDFHSGAALADSLNVSRTAVWKHIVALEDLGIEVERVRGRGYRVAGGLELLDAQRLRDGLAPHAAAFLDKLEVHRRIDSTNAALLRSPPPDAGRARVALAEMQTAGRGRRGKRWVSPYARNIYLSLDWRFEGGIGEMEGLSLAVGVAVAGALADCGVSGPRLKWPNDILWEGRKLGGILVELTGDAAGPSRAVVGVGLNVAMPAASAAAVDQPWTDLAAVSGPAPGRNQLATALLNRCLPLLADYSRGGFSRHREQWLGLDAFADRPVVVTSGTSRSFGVARGVDERGALLLETAAGTHRVRGGEVSLRGAP
jgi:BirA family biotin operon repressor/biotin-[acetyl-CoA-carboxylase] ligase